MPTLSKIIAMRMRRQCLATPANETAYDTLFQNMSPVPTMYWCEPGNPPTLPGHAAFDDHAYNSKRRAHRAIIKGRFGGGCIGYVAKEDLELFACLYKKKSIRLSARESELLNMLSREGPMNIGLIKEMTGWRVKDITPALHKLQTAFLVYEDQVDKGGDRSWYVFEREFPEVDLNRHSSIDALLLAIPRFATLSVFFDDAMLRSYYKLPGPLIKKGLDALVENKVLQHLTVDKQEGYILSKDLPAIQSETAKDKFPPMLLQRNDFLVRAFADELKERIIPSHGEILYYLLIDGIFQGAVVGKFKFGPHIIEDIVLTLPEKEKKGRKREIIQAVYKVFDRGKSPIKRYDGTCL